MDVQDYINSGILELYVAGLLSDEENKEIYLLSKSHPEIEDEIMAIETAIKTLAESVYPYSDGKNFEALKDRIQAIRPKEVIETPVRDRNWMSYTGWAAAVVMAFGLLFFYKQSAELKSEITVTSRDLEVLKEEIVNARQENNRTANLLKEIRDKNISVISLAGQQVSPESYAKVYWNTEKDMVYLDAAGLPDPPEGMVYQVWSLKLSPLTPTSIGILEEFNRDETKVFLLSNPNESEAFGITLEPAGGSETPTLSQLYTLGAIQAG